MVRQEFETRNDLEDLDVLINDVVKFCSANHPLEEFFYDVRLALEEAITNTIKYGYTDQQAHRIRVTAVFDENEFQLQIEDDGQPFDPLAIPDPNLALSVKEKPIGGLGIYLIRQVMDHVEYERQGSSNILRMKKTLRRAK